MRSLPKRLLQVTALFLIGVSAATADTARRIVSTAPSITEMLFAMGLGDRVVGVSRYCRYPPEVTKLPKVGSFLQPDAEAIARLSPDLVVLHAPLGDLGDRLTALHLRFISVDLGGLDSVYSSISQIGAAAGVPERAKELRSRIDAQLAQTRAKAARGPHPRVLLIVGRRPGTLSDIVAVGRSSYLNTILEIAGGSNALAEVAFPEYPRISLETLLRLRPDVIIDTGDMGETAEERVRQGRSNQELWRSNGMLKTAGITRVYAATTDALVIPGPRITEAAEWLRSLIQEGRTP